MPEFIQYDLQGRIIKKFYSADPSIVEGLSNILQVERNTFNSLTKYHIVDNGIVRLMTQAEKDALDVEEAQAEIDKENTRIVGLDDLMNVDLSGMILTKVDIAINNIGSLADAKIFLKKLCRYIIKYISAR